MPDAVACKRIAISKDETPGYLKGQNTCAYGIERTADNKLMGLVIYTLSEDLPGAVKLENLMIYEEFRGNGYGKELLNRSLESLKKAGVKYVIYREVSENAAELLESYNYAAANDFIPMVIDEKVLYYGIERLLSGKFSRLVPKMRDSLEKVVRLAGPGDECIVRLNERDDIGLFMIRSSFDEQLSVFYLENNEVIGAAKAYREGKKVIVNNFFLDPSCDKREVFTALAVKFGISVTVDQDIEEVVFQSVGDDRYDELINLFGEADREYPAIEMVLYL
ncbi:MAG: GNAT family N-acetyltransferase [Butyrivibrio sp.]|nr:GNAT family N-acetyltransferase [Butyrivibrio sp.]